MTAFSQVLSAALVDSLRQGAVVGLLLWVVLAMLRSQPATSRYAASCIALVAMTMLPLATIAMLWGLASDAQLTEAALPSVPPKAAAAVPQTMLQIWLVPETPRIVWLEIVQRWALPVWSFGVLLFSMRLASGWVRSLSLRRGDACSDETVLSMVQDMARRIGVVRPLRVLVSRVTDGPSVVGWLRPAILLPPAAAMGLSPQQLEAIVAHELAHVKRHDYIVNLLQILTETLFFCHPVVWWVSKQIRIERELCCDDVAVHACGDPVAYARALTTLARQSLATPQLSMGATGGSLKFRVQRLLGTAPRELEPSGAPGVIVLAVAIASAVLSIDRLQAGGETVSEKPRFEVASVRLNTLNDQIIVLQSQDGRFTARGHSLGALIRTAYQVQEFQVVDGPNWIETDLFDISATSPRNEIGASGAPQNAWRNLMLRTLLEERFNLAVHKETRERPVYALVQIRSDGRLGPQLTRSQVDCATAKGADGCGTSVGPGYIRARGVTIAQLATAFSRLTNTGSSLNRLVVDRSGLDGLYDMELRFTPEYIPNVGTSPPSVQPAVDPNGPSIFTAVQEQPGLKLDAQRGPVEVLVIDRVDRPTPD
jgi:uncharacterized protein (TIGR03435 family)